MDGEAVDEGRDFSREVDKVWREVTYGARIEADERKKLAESFALLRSDRVRCMSGLPPIPPKLPRSIPPRKKPDAAAEPTIDLVNTYEAARILGVSKSFLDKARAQPADGPKFVRKSNKIFYHRDELIAWGRENLCKKKLKPQASEVEAISAGEAAAMMGMSEFMLVKMGKVGFGPRTIRKGDEVAYRLDDVRAWVARHHPAAAKEAAE